MLSSKKKNLIIILAALTFLCNYLDKLLNLQASVYES